MSYYLSGVILNDIFLMSEHILSSASNVGWAGLLALLQQIGRFRHRDVKQFSQVETTQRGEGPQVYGS